MSNEWFNKLSSGRWIILVSGWIFYCSITIVCFIGFMYKLIDKEILTLIVGGFIGTMGGIVTGYFNRTDRPELNGNKTV